MRGVWSPVQEERRTRVSKIYFINKWSFKIKIPVARIVQSYSRLGLGVVLGNDRSFTETRFNTFFFNIGTIYNGTNVDRTVIG